MTTRHLDALYDEHNENQALEERRLLRQEQASTSLPQATSPASPSIRQQEHTARHKALSAIVLRLTKMGISDSDIRDLLAGEVDEVLGAERGSRPHRPAESSIGLRPAHFGEPADRPSHPQPTKEQPLMAKHAAKPPASTAPHLGYLGDRRVEIFPALETRDYPLVLILTNEKNEAAHRIGVTAHSLGTIAFQNVSLGWLQGRDPTSQDITDIERNNVR